MIDWQALQKDLQTLPEADLFGREDGSRFWGRPCGGGRLGTAVHDVASKPTIPRGSKRTGR